MIPIAASATGQIAKLKENTLLKTRIWLSVEAKVGRYLLDFSIAAAGLEPLQVSCLSRHNLYVTLLQSILSARLTSRSHWGLQPLSRRQSGDNRPPHVQSIPPEGAAAVRAAGAASRMWSPTRGRMDEQDFVLTVPVGPRAHFPGKMCFQIC